MAVIRPAPVGNTEFNVNDIARSKAFDGLVFGWTFTGLEGIDKEVMQINAVRVRLPRP